jgi:hypothetical protein
LSTRATLPVHGTVRDDRGHAYHIRTDGELTLLLPAEPLRLPPQAGAAEFVSLAHAEWDETPTRTFNYDRDWP